MPLSEVIKEAGTTLGIWHINEPGDVLEELANDRPPGDIKHPHKCLEWLACRALVKKLLADEEQPYDGIVYGVNGKPYLQGQSLSISLSHSFPYVAAQIAPYNVGIDLEQPKAKLHRVANRFLSESELAHANGDMVKLCIYWCAKEALYKYYGAGGLHFASHLKVAPFTLGKKGNLDSCITKDNTVSVRLGYQVQKDFVLVYTLR